MLSVYARHSAGCPKKDDTHWKRCRCPKWINGLLNGQFIRNPPKLALGRGPRTPSGNGRLRTNPHKHEPVRIDDAVGSYLTDAKARELKAATLYKLENIFRKQFLSSTQQKGLRYLKEVNVPVLREFRATWQDAPLAKKKKQERLIGFIPDESIVQDALAELQRAEPEAL